MSRMHLLMAGASAALLIVTLLVLRADHQREWKKYQRRFHEQVVPWLEQPAQTHAPAAAWGSGSPPQAVARAPTAAGAAPGAWSRRMLHWPLIEALARPLRIEQFVLPGLPLEYHFGRAVRVDRCTTCHQAIALADRDHPAQPLLPPEERFGVRIEPRSPAEVQQRATPGPSAAAPAPTRLQAVFGLRLVAGGMLDPDAPTIAFIEPASPAALAGLRAGDVIEQLDGRPVGDRTQAERLLVEAAGRGRAVELRVRRGLPHPFAGHPRLDLYVSPTSPHPAERFGCTVCHGGQGSATDFVGAAHTPNSPGRQQQWRETYGWVREPHWPDPMVAHRYLKSRCVQCHHEPLEVELLDAGAQRGRQSSQSFRPADVVAGYRLVRRYGCFGCHEIRSRDATGRSIGPAVQLEPGTHTTERGGPDQWASLAQQLPKVGPSLAGLSGRVEMAYVLDRLRDPRRFLPQTRMPRVFGLHEHLDPESRALAERLEAVEMRAIAEYLLAASEAASGGNANEPGTGAVPRIAQQPAGRPRAGPNTLAQGWPERGKLLFQMRGCLACHQHRDFPGGGGTLGPDLSSLAAKYTTPEGRAWLIRWIRDPASARPGTRMPQVPLDAFVEGNSAPAEPGGYDPAADIAAYLLFSARRSNWQPVAQNPRESFSESDLDELVARYLRRRLDDRQARQFARQGIPRELAPSLAEDEKLLLAPAGVRQKLLYVGRRSIARRGCFGCHEIPGFEAARPIGPELTAWGVKRREELAFERVDQWIEARSRRPSASARQTSPRSVGAGSPDAMGPARGEKSADAETGAFYRQAVRRHRREGFAWQKLSQPRSFDYQVAAEKDYLDWLTMGRFELSATQREQIVAFLMALRADPPPEPYVFDETPVQQALVAGHELVERFGCLECHMVRPERWTLELLPGELGRAPEVPEYDFLVPKPSADQVAASRRTDSRGLERAVVVGMPRVDAEGRLVEDEDAEGNPLYYFTLWQPALIEGRLWPVGGPELAISRRRLLRRQPALGGRLARWLYPVVLARRRAAGSAGVEGEVWGSLPPPLVDEGTKVRREWLYNYLLEPRPIRPAAVMRMPRYDLTPGQARLLAEYFSALSHSGMSDAPRFAAATPPAAQLSRLPFEPAEKQQRLERMHRAMHLLIDQNTYCAKCHLIGDYRPPGETDARLGPDLTAAGGRLRAEYLYRWLAHPQALLPYTPMPVNFPPKGAPLDASVMPASTREQLDAVADLLLNYDWYVKQGISIRRIIERAPRLTPNGPPAGILDQ